MHKIMQMTKDDGVASLQHVSLPRFLVKSWCVYFWKRTVYAEFLPIRMSEILLKFTNFLISQLKCEVAR